MPPLRLEQVPNGVVHFLGAMHDPTLTVGTIVDAFTRNVTKERLRLARRTAAGRKAANTARRTMKEYRTLISEVGRKSMARGVKAWRALPSAGAGAGAGAGGAAGGAASGVMSHQGQEQLDRAIQNDLQELAKQSALVAQAEESAAKDEAAKAKDDAPMAKDRLSYELRRVLDGDTDAATEAAAYKALVTNTELRRLWGQPVDARSQARAVVKQVKAADVRAKKEAAAAAAAAAEAARKQAEKDKQAGEVPAGPMTASSAAAPAAGEVAVGKADDAQRTPCKPCRCGSFTHARTSHKTCRLYNSKKRKSPG